MSTKAMIELVVLGSGTAIPSARRRSSGYLLQTGRSCILVESGPGTMQAIARAGYDFHDIDAIFYSHLHVDHTASLAQFLFASRLPDDPRTKALLIAGPPGTGQLLDGFRELYTPWLEPETFKLEVREISHGSFDFIDWNIGCLPVEHTDNALAYRFEHESGKVIAYSGDSDYCENLVRIARGADIALLECSYPDGMKVRGHLTPSLAGKVAREAGCGKLVLTHFYPPCDEVDVVAGAKSEYPGEVIRAEDNMTIEVTG
ncbi:MAG: MBL fold metallo-hydrolase [Candidatus Tritonobacter lacicola]|nr:MBL fold metallo-hydrolase [Candidatus Tritonobacter lacicola]